MTSIPEEWGSDQDETPDAIDRLVDSAAPLDPEMIRRLVKLLNPCSTP